MNHLAHFFLAGGNKDLVIGGFLGDFIKGRLKGERETAIENGIRLHRAIDAYTDGHAITRLSKERFDKRFRRFAGIMTDIIFDHFLARHWQRYHETGLQDFSDSTLNMLLDGGENLPVKAIRTCEWMQCSNTLINYRNQQFIDRSFCYLSERLSRQNPLKEGYAQFLNNSEELDTDFGAFFPEVILFADNWIDLNTDMDIHTARAPAWR